MPDGKTHVAIGAGIFAGFFILNKQLGLCILTNMDWLILLIICWIYSQLPDADSDVSTINKYVNSLAALLVIYSFYSDNIYLGIASAGLILLLEWVKHRGILHSMLAGAIAVIPLYLMSPVYAIFGLACFAGHIIADGDFSWMS